MKIAILTAYNCQYRDIAQITNGNKLEYCQKFDYDFISCFAKEMPDKTPHWYKIIALQKFLPIYDYIMWTDTDALITNFFVTIEDIILEYYNKFLLISITEPPHRICSSNFIIKNDFLSYYFINAILEKKDWYNKDLWEQGAMQEIINENKAVREEISFLEPRVINAGPSDWKTGDFIYHAASHVYDIKIEFVKEKIQHVVK